MSKQLSDRWIQSLAVGVTVMTIAGIGYWTIAGTIQNSIATQAANLTPTKLAASAVNITVYRTPTCGCCEGWVEHLQQHNFQVTDLIKPEADIQTIRQKHNLPSQLASCHTAEMNGYLVEGHVPVEDVKKLLVQKPNIAGIAVPGMPIGTPGMEMGNQKQSFEVISFQQNGKVEVFNSYQF